MFSNIGLTERRSLVTKQDERDGRNRRTGRHVKSATVFSNCAVRLLTLNRRAIHLKMGAVSQSGVA